LRSRWTTPLTETAAVIGTLPYMSPEQRTGSRVDARSDLYSVGVMLYESATGRLPWGSFPPPSRVSRAFSPAFDRVVTRLLQPEPDARFAGAAATAGALRAALRPPRTAARLAGAGAAAVLAAAIGIGLPALTRFEAGRGRLRGQDARSGAIQQAGMTAPLPLWPAPPPPERQPMKGIRVKAAPPKSSSTVKVRVRKSKAAMPEMAPALAPSFENGASVQQVPQVKQGSL
jgi:serine/threonine protein kinase